MCFRVPAVSRDVQNNYVAAGCAQHENKQNLPGKSLLALREFLRSLGIALEKPVGCFRLRSTSWISLIGTKLLPRWISNLPRLASGTVPTAWRWHLGSSSRVRMESPGLQLTYGSSCVRGFPFELEKRGTLQKKPPLFLRARE